MTEVKRRGDKYGKNGFSRNKRDDINELALMEGFQGGLERNGLGSRSATTYGSSGDNVKLGTAGDKTAIAIRGINHRRFLGK